METGSHIRLVLWKAAKAVDRVDRDSIRKTGLSLSDFTIMEALLHKGPLPINQIGEKVLLSSGSMTAAVNRLEKAGHVQRIQDPSDGRCYYVHLTKAGRRIVAEAYRRHAQNLEKVADALTAEERTQLVHLLKKLGNHAQQITVGP
jgi:MarR family 2-MHQ and catechol resistance regulon transcriptional repressor